MVLYQKLILDDTDIVNLTHQIVNLSPSVQAIPFLSFSLSPFFFGGGVFSLFRAAPEAYGGSQARCRIWPEPQQHEIRAESVTYTTAHGNAGSLTH